MKRQTPLYCCFACSSLTSRKVNWLARIWMLAWARTFSASSSVISSRMIEKLYWDKWQNQKASAFVQARGQTLTLLSEAAKPQTSPSGVLPLLELQHSSRAGNREATEKNVTPPSLYSLQEFFSERDGWRNRKMLAATSALSRPGLPS